VGFLPWMGPSTASAIKGLGAQGHQRILAGVDRPEERAVFAVPRQRSHLHGAEVPDPAGFGRHSGRHVVGCTRSLGRPRALAADPDQPDQGTNPPMSYRANQPTSCGALHRTGVAK
jgi:hypothetical protein